MSETTKNPKEAQAALDAAVIMTRAGQSLGRWPRWAAAFDGVSCGALMTGFVYLLARAFPADPGTAPETLWLAVALAVLALPSIIFRFYWRAKVGAMAALSGGDILRGSLGVAGVIVAFSLLNNLGWHWPAWGVGVLYAIALYFARRRAGVCPVVDHG